MPGAGYTPPPYPYDRLDELRSLADAMPGGVIDLSIGTPTDAPAQLVIDALAQSGAERGYPPSVGTTAFREAAAGWMRRRLGVAVPVAQVAACIGTKELVAGLPQWLRLRSPDRDTVLYPAVSYPTYAMGATLAGCRAVPVAVDEAWHLDLGSITASDAKQALCLWVDSPGNPTGAVEDLGAMASWGRRHSIPVLSDECYTEFTWDGPPRTILEHGTEGVMALHSLSKRSNLAGARVGFYAGDADLVSYVSDIRKHAGFMVPGPVQAAAIAAWGDDAHVDEQRARYLERLQRLAGVLEGCGWGLDAPLPTGGFYLWVPAPQGDAWALVRRLATEVGVLASPGEFYGQAGAGHVRFALVQPLDRIDLVAERLASARASTASGRLSG